MKEQQHVFTKIIHMPVSIKETIIDIETTGLNPQEDNIISIAYTKQDKIIAHVLKNPEEQETHDLKHQKYYQTIKEELQQLNQPWYAYNASFERSFITRKLPVNQTIRFIDIQEPLRKNCTQAKHAGVFIKWPRLTEIIPNTILPYYGMINPEINAKDVITEWELYKEDKNTSHLEKIAFHNIMDIIRSIEALFEILTLQITQEKENKQAMYTFLCEICGEEKKPQELYVVYKMHNNKNERKNEPYFYVCEECFSY